MRVSYTGDGAASSKVGIRRARDARYLPQGHVALDSTWCYPCHMGVQPEITQRDLRIRSKEIMDAVENGQAFTVTRDGHRIGELIPLRRRRRFVPRQEFAAMSGTAAVVDVGAFRADQDASADHRLADPYAG